MQNNSRDRLLVHHAVRNAGHLARLAMHGVPESEIEKLIEIEMGRGKKKCDGPEGQGGQCPQELAQAMIATAITDERASINPLTWPDHKN